MGGIADGVPSATAKKDIPESSLLKMDELGGVVLSLSGTPESLGIETGVPSNLFPRPGNLLLFVCAPPNLPSRLSRSLPDEGEGGGVDQYL